MITLGEKLKTTPQKGNWYTSALLIGTSVFIFLLTIQLMGDSFARIGGVYTQYILDATSNPSVGLFIGLLATALLHSSSTTTSMAVAMVASGTISLENAIPIIMGANIGTTLTSTIVSLSYLPKAAEFRRAFSAGILHDVFNILTVCMLFPLENAYGWLSKSSKYIASLINLGETGSSETSHFLIFRVFKSISTLMLDWLGPYVVLLLAVAMLFGTVKFISNMLYQKLVGGARNQFEAFAFSNTWKSFGIGFLLTSVVQSSSLTTSLIVPLAATAKVKLNRAFQFIMGANVGTTITALIAASFKSEAAISLAIAHFLFNVIGTSIFLFIPFLRQLPLVIANWLGAISMRFRLSAVAYILVVFFILPFTLIYFSRQTETTKFSDPTSFPAGHPAGQETPAPEVTD